MPIVRYKIAIEAVEEYDEDENLVIKKTPTQFKEKSRYNDDEKVAYVEEYAVKKVKKYREYNILTQKVVAEGFNLDSVIKAINNIK